MKLILKNKSIYTISHKDFSVNDFLINVKTSKLNNGFVVLAGKYVGYTDDVYINPDQIAEIQLGESISPNELPEPSVITNDLKERRLAAMKAGRVRKAAEKAALASSSRIVVG